jgi:hypothetical protein
MTDATAKGRYTAPTAAKLELTQVTLGTPGPAGEPIFGYHLSD